MTEFSKEELYKIFAIVHNHFCNIDGPDVDNMLVNKIESLIDSYCESACEHAWVIARNEPINIDDCVKRFFICIKCHEVDE